MELSTTKDVSTSILVEKYIYQGFLLMVNPITIAVSEIKCLDETSELSASDEPYVLVVAADLQPLVPNTQVVLYGALGDVDAGETHSTLPLPVGADPNIFDSLPFVVRKPFWGLNGKPALVNNPAQVIFLVALMEYDDGNPEAARGLVKVKAVASLLSSIDLTKTSNTTRADRVNNLIADIDSALGIPTGFPNFDDKVGFTQELQLTSQDLSLANTGVHTKTLNFKGDGGEYNIVFELKKG